MDRRPETAGQEFFPKTAESLLEVAENLRSSALALQQWAAIQQRRQGSEKVKLGKQELSLQSLTASGSAAEQV